jgi:arsenite methyltransferase
MSTVATTEAAVFARYSAASQCVEPALCCPVQYCGDYLAAIPQEVLDKDYGCGDPSPYVHAGETVLDLGAGGGKLCFILAQVVGPQGRVIGVDANPDMLELARRYRPQVAANLGYDNVEFRNGLIQDLRLDLDRWNNRLASEPITSARDWLRARTTADDLCATHPLVADVSIDCIVSNCVLNLVRRDDRLQLFAEMHRVLRHGGRVAISDIVASEDVPLDLQRDAEAWSGCLSGAYREDEFLQAFVAAGFHGVTLARRESQPWRTLGGIEFRSVTVVAWKDARSVTSGEPIDVIYRGPFAQVVDDRSLTFPRGVRVTVATRDAERLRHEPYAGHFERFDDFSREQQGGAVPLLVANDNCCGPATACCDPPTL